MGAVNKDLRMVLLYQPENYSSKEAVVEKGAIVNVLKLDSRKAFCTVFFFTVFTFGKQSWG